MPPRASTSRKKTRLDVHHDEVQRALLAHVVAQSSAEQPVAQQQPSAEQQQPSAEQQQSSAAEQQPSAAQSSHSPVLPLVLPTLSIHSTSGSTASTTTSAGLPVRSIRSRNAVAAAAVSGT